MILIEATNISQGGAKVLLEYLHTELLKKKIKHIILLNEKVKEFFSKNESFYFTQINPFNRKSEFKKLLQKFTPSSIICFGNFPLPFKTKNIPVYTYFHRPYLVNGFHNPHKKTHRLLYYLKRLYLKSHINNTNYFIFQSSYIRDLFINTYNYDKNKTIIIPFFNSEKISSIIARFSLDFKEEAFIYVSNSAKHKNHNNLFKAWELLFINGLSPILYVTIPKNDPITKKIKILHKKGINIVNLGELPYEKVLEKTAEVRYVIFPSFAETLGLGLVEGCLMNCYILSSDLPFIYEVVKPTKVFNPNSPNSIAKLVANLHNSELNESEIILDNKINDLIQLILNA